MPARRRRPSACFITPAGPTRSARSMKARPSWTGWSRSRSAASRSRRPPPPASGTTIASTSSTRRATSISRSKSSARLRVLDGAVAVFDSVARRRAAVGDGLASGRQVQRAAHLLRQQDGSHRRRLLSLRRHDQGSARRRPLRCAAADRRGGRLHRRRRSREDARRSSGRTRASARSSTERRYSGRHGRSGGGIPARADRNSPSSRTTR